MDERELLTLVKADETMMSALQAARELNLPDWWIAAGFVRSKVWDVLSGMSARTRLPDIDVIYFDAGDPDEATEKRYETELRLRMPDMPWSVKNQARMHAVSGRAPYRSSLDAVANYPETATALALSLDADGQPVLGAPHGLADVVAMLVAPTPAFAANPALYDIFERRIEAKRWDRIWPSVSYAR
ncbi:nucleotidyltransferase family protein [Cohnella rhizosphaerae]|uniref:Nucleotidyltransferase family protein n=1 Tax=Cohnella rhizosphaerae TaxID=1457232 RepID=A0A9X4KY01_9BACL|nr:nucleotidyltransferase family protein [Cohnella rhizosphaerae]MDG0813255.1 nucleotidyltransferase family protein [Cohnella rhizosphaerae]